MLGISVFDWVLGGGAMIVLSIISFALIFVGLNKEREKMALTGLISLACFGSIMVFNFLMGVITLIMEGV